MNKNEIELKSKEPNPVLSKDKLNKKEETSRVESGKVFTEEELKSQKRYKEEAFKLARGEGEVTGEDIIRMDAEIENELRNIIEKYKGTKYETKGYEEVLEKMEDSNVFYGGKSGSKIHHLALAGARTGNFLKNFLLAQKICSVALMLLLSRWIKWIKMTIPIRF